VSENSGGEVRAPREPGGFGWSEWVADGAVVVYLAGELDLSTAAEFGRRLMEVAESGAAPTIVLDLSDVSFIDARCTGLIVSAWSAAKFRGRELCVDGLHGVSARIFGVLGLESILARRELAASRGGKVDGRFEGAGGSAARWDSVGAAHEAR